MVLCTLKILWSGGSCMCTFGHTSSLGKMCLFILTRGTIFAAWSLNRVWSPFCQGWNPIYLPRKWWLNHKDVKTHFSVMSWQQNFLATNVQWYVTGREVASSHCTAAVQRGYSRTPAWRCSEEADTSRGPVATHRTEHGWERSNDLPQLSGSTQ